MIGPFPENHKRHLHLWVVFYFGKIFSMGFFKLPRTAEQLQVDLVTLSQNAAKSMPSADARTVLPPGWSATAHCMRQMCFDLFHRPWLRVLWREQIQRKREYRSLFSTIPAISVLGSERGEQEVRSGVVIRRISRAVSGNGRSDALRGKDAKS